eukprot:6524716-Pyramimonas_sp.AAC.1
MSTDTVTTQPRERAFGIGDVSKPHRDAQCKCNASRASQAQVSATHRERRMHRHAHSTIFP